MTRNTVGQHSLREINLVAVLGEVFDAAAAPSRAAVAGRLGLAKATVSTLVDQLIEARILQELPPLAPARAGRPAVPLAPRPRTIVGMGLEVNIEYIGGRILDLTGEVVAERIVESDLTATDPQEVLGALGDLARGLMTGVQSEGMAVAGARLALPGLVRPRLGRLEVAPNLGWHDLEPVPMLGLGDLAVELRNEAKLAGLAQTAMRSAMVGGGPASELSESFVYVSGDVGIGSAILVNRDLFEGEHGWSGEIGHVVVHPGGRVCSCGNQGCLEQYAGKSALLATAGLAPHEPIDALTARLASADPAALDAVAAAADALGDALGDYINLVDVSAVVLGGIYVKLFEYIAPPIRERLVARVLGSRWEPPSVHRAPIGRFAALSGGAREVLRGVLADPVAWVAPQSSS